MRQHLGEFEQLLLFALLDLEDQAHGVAIRRAIEDKTGRVVSPGAIYTALERLVGRGFVASEIGDTTPERGGRRRKFYRLEALVHGSELKTDPPSPERGSLRSGDGGSVLNSERRLDNTPSSSTAHGKFA